MRWCCLPAVVVVLFVLVSCGNPSNLDLGQSAKLAVVGGKPTTETSYLVQLMADSSADRGLCGGVLIGPRLVLTAAHCLDDVSLTEMHVALGFEKTGNLSSTKSVKVVAAARHERFSGEPEDGNDIALLYLAEYDPNRLEKPVQPIAWEALVNAKLPQTLKVIGAGTQSSLGDVYSDDIQEAVVSVIPNRQCSNLVPALLSSQLCAGQLKTGGVDSCRGDSGGPLVRTDGPASVLVGIVSYGQGCAQKGKPSVYTKVAAFADWIREKSDILRSSAALDTRRMTSTELKEAISARCLGQIGHVTKESRRGDTVRQTVWRVNPDGIEYKPATLVPAGEVVVECSFADVAGRSVSVKWLKVKGGGAGFVSVVTLADGSQFLSSPWKTRYQQDRVTCKTARGSVGLFDQRQDTFVEFEGLFYRLGDSVADPRNSDTTWGCRIDDVSVELFYTSKRSQESASKLAARVTHGSIGTVTAVLVPARLDPNDFVQANLNLDSSGDEADLEIRNVGEEDLFTWKLTCFREFSLKLTEGSLLKSVASSDGTSFSVVVDSAVSASGRVAQKSTATFPVKALSEGVFNCTLNGVFPVIER